MFNIFKKKEKKITEEDFKTFKKSKSEELSKTKDEKISDDNSDLKINYVNRTEDIDIFNKNIASEIYNAALDNIYRRTIEELNIKKFNDHERLINCIYCIAVGFAIQGNFDLSYYIKNNMYKKLFMNVRFFPNFFDAIDVIKALNLFKLVKASQSIDLIVEGMNKEQPQYSNFTATIKDEKDVLVIIGHGWQDGTEVMSTTDHKLELHPNLIKAKHKVFSDQNLANLLRDNDILEGFVY